MLLENKTAFITGAGRGIGRKIALTMAAEGANIIIADIDEKTMAATKEEVEALGVKCVTVKTDISDKACVEESVQTALAALGKIDILVNNAAIFREAPFLEMSDDAWDLNYKINIKGIYNVLRTVAPILAKNEDGGRIVSIASVDAFQGCRNYSHYAMAKAGVVGISRTLAQELGPYNVRVNCVAPGITMTDMTKDRIEANHDKYVASIPLARVGQPQDIANAVLFLASDLSSYVTGQVLHVNGGVYFG